MELLGSIHALSGSMSASVFTGSFKGDASGLYNIPASGVTGLNLSQISTGSVTASVSLDGFNVNSDTSITGSLTISGTVVSQTTTLVSGSPQIDITNTTNYTSFSSSIATTDLNQENRLNALETSSGSLNSFTSSIDTTIKNKLNAENVISSSAQVTQYGFATTGSNTFIGTQTLSGSIIPAIDNAYDLGSPTYQWRDVYISSGSLYVDGTKVLSSTAQELLITTDTGQSIKILEGTTDSIILQTADGDIELKSSADGDILLDPTNGKIMLKGPVEILNGNKIQSSVGGTPVVFANDIVVSGSIDITGTIEGIDLTNFSSSVNTRISNLESSAGSLNSFTSSTNNRLSAIETSTSSLNSFTSSINTTIKNKLDSESVISGSVQIDITNTTNYTTFSSSISSSIGSLSGSVATTTNNLSTSVAIYDLAQDNRLNSIEGKTGSYATTGSNVFQGSQTITGSLFISQNLIVGGSSSINFVSQSTLNIGTNLITVNAQNPETRFGGLAVIDSGSSPTVSGSMLFDSINDQWIFVHQAIAGSPTTSSVVLMGPESFNSLGSEIYPTTNRVVKSINSEHLGDSNISDNGTTVTILSNTIINGTISATGTTLVSGSAQISHDSSTGYVANRHIDHTAVSITAGNGLSGGGDISATRTVTLDTGSVHFLDGVKKELNTEGVISGSSQVSFNGISDKPALVSGSSQITYSGLSGIPSGIVSGSSQITYGSISSIPSGIVSGSAQIDLTNTTNYSSGIKTRLNAEGVLSGSAQVVSALPSGTVSGSAQITLSSTTGYASYDANVVHISGNETITGVKTFENSSTDQIIIKSTSTGTTDNGAVITMQGSDGVSNRTFAYISALKENGTSGNYSSRLVFFTRANGAGLSEVLSLASNKNATFSGSINGLVVSSGTITTGTWNGTAIANAYLANSSFHIGTTSISLGRASASQTLTGVSIDGNAATATSATSATSASSATNSTYINSHDLRTIAPNSHDAYKLRFGFTSWANNNTSPYADYLHFRSYSDNSGGADNLLMFRKNDFGIRLWQQTFGSSTAYASYKDVAFTDGTGASGTWGIRITGFANAGTLRLYASDSPYRYDDATPYYMYMTYDGNRWLLQVSPATPANVRVAYADSAGSASSATSATTATNSTQLGGYSLDGATSIATRIFNNKGQNHGTYTNFNTVMTPGPNYIQGPTNGPTGTAGGQWYGFMFGLGAEYGTSTGSAGHYASQLYYSRISQDSNQYLWARDMEGGSWGSWRKLYAGYADTAGNITSYTINQNLGTGNSPSFSGLIVNGDLLVNGNWSSNSPTTYSEAFTIQGTYPSMAFRSTTSTKMWLHHMQSDGALTWYHDGGNYTTENWSQKLLLMTNGTLYSASGGDLGTSSYRWGNVYTNDLHLSNEGKEGGNDVDGTTGDWTIQEGEENLYIINNKNGKKFKIELTEIV